MPASLTAPTFDNINSFYIQSCFRDTLARFPELANRRITLRRTRKAKTTMRAQPIVNLRFLRRGLRDYRVDISSRAHIREQIPLDQLPRQVLMGWMAHELGHIVDYLPRSLFGMIGFVIGYLCWPSYRIAAERRADLIAIDHGFGEELIATKQYILAHTGLPQRYLSQIRRYYLSPEQIVEMLPASDGKSAVRVDDLL